MAIRLISNFFQPREEILQDPDKRLREISKKVNLVDKNVKEIAEKLTQVIRKIDRLYKPWLGLAANQIGYNKRVIVIKKSFQNYEIMINPEVLGRKWNFYSISGCFSLKGLYLLKRYFWLKVRYQDLQKDYHEKVFRGGYAAVLQQEIDHLNGRLIYD